MENLVPQPENFEYAPSLSARGGDLALNREIQDRLIQKVGRVGGSPNSIFTQLDYFKDIPAERERMNQDKLYINADYTALSNQIATSIFGEAVFVLHIISDNEIELGRNIYTFEFPSSIRLFNHLAASRHLQINWRHLKKYGFFGEDNADELDYFNEAIQELEEIILPNEKPLLQILTNSDSIGYHYQLAEETVLIDDLFVAPNPKSRQPNQNKAESVEAKTIIEPLVVNKVEVENDVFKFENQLEAFFTGHTDDVPVFEGRPDTNHKRAISRVIADIQDKNNLNSSERIKEFIKLNVL